MTGLETCETYDLDWCLCGTNATSPDALSHKSVGCVGVMSYAADTVRI